ncbi:MAG: tRNA (guanosine(37)-N1)-methyltransferase TrmD [Rickettsiales bacterium]
MTEQISPIFSTVVLTLFPEMFPGSLGHSLAGKALEQGIWSLKTLQIRDFATDKHKTVDDKPFGGGAGMVMKPDVIDAAIKHAKTLLPPTTNHQPPTIIYPSPRGKPLTQSMVEKLKDTQPIIVCGRFEGIDQRVIDHHNMQEISLGDFILSGGEIAAMAIIDSCVRLLDGVIGNSETLLQESFNNNEEFTRLLEYPHYTRPSVWKGMSVPEVLLSGNHKEILRWRLEQAREITQARRPDLVGMGKDK